MLLAPVFSGREQAREMAITAKIADEYLGVPQDVPEGALAVAGFRFTAPTLQTMKAVKAPATQLPGIGRVLLLDKPGRSSADAISALLPSEATVETRPFDAYATLTFDPTASRPPAGLLAAVADFAAAGSGDARHSSPSRRPMPV